MRPSLLDPYFASVRSLPGVGPKVALLLGRVAGGPAPGGEPCIVDILHLAPSSIIDRRNRPEIAFASQGAIVTLELRVDRHQPAAPGNRNAPYRVFCHDQTGEIALTFFHANRSWLERSLPVGETVVVSGRMDWFNGRPSMVHPDHIALLADAAALPLIEPVYPLTEGLSGKVVTRAIGAALDRVPELSEWIEPSVVAREHFPHHRAALDTLHEPKEPIDVDIAGPPRRRLAYDEFLAGQLALALVRMKAKRLSGRPLGGDGRLRKPVLDTLPYSLTRSQTQALAEISADLSAPERMLRLLQGDVGSGKTIVALLAMAQAAEAGGQSAFMAPTEVLARQHFATIRPVAERAGLAVALLTGREKGREREDILDRLRRGDISIIVGTHALFQEKVDYRDLVLAVIDEQHRFGVHQRMQLTVKGAAPDMLVMTATPIPRTLVLAAFGDMDVSRLTEKPAGRKPVATVTLPLERIGELVDRMRAAIADGQKVYWVCPLVEELEAVDLTAAVQRFETLKAEFGDAVGLVHGQMKGHAKDEAMAAFKTGKTRILVATTVIEVGVDVSDATIIVVEHAERFGLSQLHQLRGRVGRGEKRSTCVLLYKGPLGDTAKARLEVMRETEDGFRIAEEDLKLRGEGELLGTRQSGVPGFRLASLEAHADILAMARDDARLLLNRDPDLETERGKAVRLLLYLFRRDEAIRLLRAG